MSKLKVMAFSISLDGYGAGPDQSLEHPLGVGGTAHFLFQRSDDILTAVTSAHGPHLDLPHEALVGRIHAEVCGIVGDTPPPAWSKVIVEKRATFACTPGLRRPAGVIAPGLLACGDYIDGPYPATLEGAVRSGVAAGSLP